MLTDLANKIAQAPAPVRDPEADELIRSKIGSRPDALYVLAQTVLIQNLALDHANQQIRDLQQHPPQAQPGYNAPPSYNAPPAYNAPPPAYTPPPAPPPSPSFFGGGGASGFLRSAATTAAGVAAGALAFEGIRSLFGGIEHLAGFGSTPHFSSFMGQAPGAETVINNYYDSPSGGTADDASLMPPDDTSGDVTDDDTTTVDDTAGADDFDNGDDGSSGGDDLV